MAKRPVDPRTTYLRARAEVIGYPEPLLEAFRDLVRQVDANPQLGAVSGQMMAGISARLVVEDVRASEFISAIGHLVTVAAQVALEKKEETNA